MVQSEQLAPRLVLLLAAIQAKRYSSVFKVFSANMNKNDENLLTAALGEAVGFAVGELVGLAVG